MPADPAFQRWVSDENGALRKARFALVLVALYVGFSATYLTVNLFSVGRPANTLFLPGEERLPFLPAFEYLYVLTFFIPALLVVTIRDYPGLRRLIRALVITLVVAYSTYLAFPVYVPRPVLLVSSLHTWLLSLQYLDKPYNNFPSLHVGLSWLTVFSAQVSQRTRIALGVLAFGVSISTLFVKQHYLADAAFGTALAWVAWRLAGRDGSSRTPEL